MDKSSITPIQRFWLLLKPDGKEVRNIYIYSIFSGLISLSLPLGIQAIVNLIQGGQINTSWVILVFFVVLGIAITGALQVFQLRIMENLQQKIFARAAFDFSHRITKIKIEALYKHYAPELMNRFFDVVSVQKGLTKILIDFSAAIFIIFFSLILLSFYHSFFILFSVLLLILIYAIFRYTAKKGMSTSLQESKFKYKIAYWLEEVARTSISFKLAGKSDLPLQRTNKFLDKYLIARDGHFKVLVQQYSLLIVFKVVTASGLLAMGGYLVMDQQMNIGQFVAAEIIILIVMASVEKLILSANSIYDTLTSLEKIGQVTDFELERENGTILQDFEQDGGLEIELNKVNFAYPEAQKKALNNTSISIKKGEMLILTGENNAGKSTLLSVIAGLYEPQSGSIVYNGLPIGNLSLSSVRASIGEYLLTCKLFEGSVYDNIALGRPRATFDHVKWALKNVGLEEFIQNLPEGYNTELNTQGKGLSKSVASKLLLARAIATKPKLLLLEDIFGSLDKKSSKKIIDFLVDKQNSWTIVAISSSAYFAKLVDNIAVLEDGKVIRSGSLDAVKNMVQFKN